MAAPSKPVGYECEFVDEVYEELFCRRCKHVARRASIVNCCGETFCEECIQYEEPCPVDDCQQQTTQHIVHRKYVLKILALKVYCSLKDRGCEWTGQLQHLDAHLDVATGDCVYVDVDCPSKCNQKVPKCNMDTHLCNHCPNRDYTCPHCSFKSTFGEISQHFETCQNYPTECPNKCGAIFERNVLEDHLKECGLQMLQCEYRYAGCEDEFTRYDQKEHMEQNIQKHQALIEATNQEEQQRTLEKKLEQSYEQQATLEKKLEEKEQEIKMLEAQQNRFLYYITIPSFQESKSKDDKIYGPKEYTHSGGYRYQISIRPNGSHTGYGTHVSVKVYPLAGDYDTRLKYPARFTITLELLNQHRDQDHYTKNIHCEVKDMGGMYRAYNLDYIGIGFERKFIPHTDLEWNADKQTQYLKNNCLKFRVSKLVVHN